MVIPSQNFKHKSHFVKNKNCQRSNHIYYAYDWEIDTFVLKTEG
jgi:hypothetical protein